MASTFKTLFSRYLLVATAIFLTSESRVRAQSCVREDQATTRCRIMLSQPRAFTVEGGADLAGAQGRGSATLTIEVDGRPCLRAEMILLRRLSGRCRAVLSVGEHTIAAMVTTSSGRPLGVGVDLRPSARLATLPHDYGDLVPKRR